MARPRLTPKRIDDGNGNKGFDGVWVKKVATILAPILLTIGGGGGYTMSQIQAAKEDAAREAKVDIQIFNLDQKVEFLVQSQRIDHDLLTTLVGRDETLGARLDVILRELEKR